MIVTDNHIIFDDAELKTMSADDVARIQQDYGARHLMRLPSYEIDFMEWLKTADPPVWNDLWENSPDEPYYVSLAFLNEVTGDNAGSGWIIRDLVSTENFYFAPALFIEKESTAFIDASKERFLRNDSLTPAQLLAVEASMGPVDIWHFAYRHDLSINVVKRAVRELVDDRILLHVPDADHLSQFFDVD